MNKDPKSEKLMTMNKSEIRNYYYYYYYYYTC